jgi:hypothetical protein
MKSASSRRSARARTTSSVGCHATHLTSWLCSIMTPMHSKSASGLTRGAAKPVNDTNTTVELGDHLPRPILSCLCYTLQATSPSPSTRHSCIPFRAPPTTRRIPIRQTRTERRRPLGPRVFPIPRCWRQRSPSRAFSPRAPMQRFGPFWCVLSGSSSDAKRQSWMGHMGPFGSRTTALSCLPNTRPVKV